MRRRLEARPWFRPLFIAACVVAVAVQWVVIVHRQRQSLGDFGVSREFGRRFLAGEYLYAGGLHYPYLPSAALAFAPLALVGPRLGIVLRYGVAVASLLLTLGMLHRMARREGGGVSPAPFAAGAVTLVLASRYILRDLDDGGPHLILLAIVVAGMYGVQRGREGLGGIWFGLATALKATPGLFLPFFLWKRQWRLAACTAAAAAGWIVLPAVWMGPESWWRHQQEWARVALGSALGSRAPGVAASEERVQNQALRPALMRFLATSPGGAPPRPAPPGAVPTVGLRRETAGPLAAGATLGLAAICFWRARRPYRGPADPAWPAECSAVLILALLLSPVTWLQHLVWMAPALYLIVAEGPALKARSRAARAALGVYVLLALLLNREVVGRENAMLLLGYSVHTVCMLLVLGLLLLRRPAAAPGPARDGPGRPW